jgi:transcription-repair coupling factor (superfamily II helicase)
VRKRISAIKQYSSLGSGFKIAMRDLEIRGAGNLLGPQQSGHITAVGFELYCQLLKQSVSAAKGEKTQPRLEVQMRVDFLAFNPGEELSPEPLPPTKSKKEDKLIITVPRDVATYSRGKSRESAPAQSAAPIPRAGAHIPFKYIRESRQRIEAYRKLAQATDKASLEGWRVELRDRFGKNCWRKRRS